MDKIKFRIRYKTNSRLLEKNKFLPFIGDYTYKNDREMRTVDFGIAF